MGYLACPVCEHESLVNVRDLQQRVATALTRPLNCPICSATVNGLQAFHQHLGSHLPAHQNPYADTSPATPSHHASPYPPTASPDAIPTLEHLDISDGAGSPHSPSAGPRRLEDRASLDRSSSSKSLQDLTLFQPPLDGAPSSSSNNCDLCGLVFSSEHFLKIHKDIIHTKTDYFDVSCKLCKEKFKDFEAYRQHVRESHTDRRYICELCPKTFKMKGSLMVHTRMFHDPCSPGRCQVCQKTFTTKARRELHEKRYHGIGLEHLFQTGKASPPSPSTRQQQQTPPPSSSLGDAKNWLETLMTENKEPADASLRSQDPQVTPVPQSYPQHQYLPPPPRYGLDPQFQDTSDLQHLRDQHHLPATSEALHQLVDLPQDSFPRQVDPQDQPKWLEDCQPHMPPPDMTQTKMADAHTHFRQPVGPHSFQHHDFQDLAGHTLDCGELKQEKKVPIAFMGGGVDEGAGRGLQSPVTVVPPQPHKAETPPAPYRESSPGPSEARRNSFPFVSMNKPGMAPCDPGRLHHHGSFVSDFSLSPATSSCSSSHGDNKIPPNFVAPQPMMYHRHHPAPLATSLPSMSILPPTGARVTPIFLPNHGYPGAKMEDGSNSPTQATKGQDGDATGDVTPGVEGEVRDSSVGRTRDSSSEPRTDTSRAHRSSPNKKDTSKSDGKQWECEVCKKSFTTKYFLKKHKRLHTGETPYACEECGKTFTFQQSYHKHILYHSDDKPHQCSYCGRSFKEMSTLHNHVRIHTGEKPFVCETCGKAFRQRVSYLVHQRIHTGVMPYTCETCNRSFRYKVSLRSHRCEPGTGTSSPGGGGGGGSRRVDTTTGGGDRWKNSPGGPTTSSNTPLPTTAPSTPATATPPPLTPLHPPPASGGGVHCGSGGKAGEGVAGGPGEGVAGGSPHLLPTTSPPPPQPPPGPPPSEETPAALQAAMHLLDGTGYGGGGRLRVPLETIDLAAIGCDSPLSAEGKRSPHKTSGGYRISPSHPGISRGPVGGAHQSSQEPLSMAFLHALVDPQQGRIQGDCRPHLPLGQDTLAFLPSLSPGAMDADMEHDSFLTNLLM